MKKLSWIPHFWVVGFIVAPILYVVALSFQTKGLYGGVEWGLTLQNYEKASSLSSLLIFRRTLIMAFLTALACTSLGGVCASFICRGSEVRRFFWLVIFLMPFFISGLIRLHSLQNFVGSEGPLQGMMKFFIPSFDGGSWSHNSFIMGLGLILTYLPLALLPLTAAFEKWDQVLSEASWDLGANPWQSFRWVKWPILRPTFLASFFIVFIPCLGEYLAPEILEGARNLYWGQYITEAFLKWRNWPLGAALGVLLMLGLALTLFVNAKVQKWNR